MKFKLKLIKLFLFNLCACSTFTFIATKTQSTVAMESMNNEKKEKNISNKDFVSTMSEKFVTIFKKYFNMVKNKNKDNSNIKSFFESKDLEWLLRGQANSLLYNNNNYNESIIKKTLIPGLFSDNIDMKNLFKEYDNKIQQNGYRKYILDEKNYDNYYDLIKYGGYYDLKSENYDLKSKNYDNFFDKLKIDCQDFFLSNINKSNELNKQKFSDYLVKQFEKFLDCKLCDDFVITRYFCFGIKLYYDMKNLPKVLVNKSSDNDKNDVNQDITKIEQMLVDTAKKSVLDNFNNMLTESLDNTFKEIQDIQLFNPDNGNFLTDMNKMSNTLQNLKYLPKEFDSYVNDVLLEKVDQIFFKDNVVGKLEYLIDTKNDEDNVTDVENIFVKKYFYIILNDQLDWSGKDNLKLKNEKLDKLIETKFKNLNIYKFKNLLLIYLKYACKENNISNFSKLIKNVLDDYKKLKDKCKENNGDFNNHANPQIYSDFFQICRKLINIYKFLFYIIPMSMDNDIDKCFGYNDKKHLNPNKVVSVNEYYYGLNGLLSNVDTFLNKSKDKNSKVYKVVLELKYLLGIFYFMILCLEDNSSNGLNAFVNYFTKDFKNSNSLELLLNEKVFIHMVDLYTSDTISYSLSIDDKHFINFIEDFISSIKDKIKEKDSDSSSTFLKILNEYVKKDNSYSDVCPHFIEYDKKHNTLRKLIEALKEDLKKLNSNEISEINKLVDVDNKDLIEFLEALFLKFKNNLNKDDIDIIKNDYFKKNFSQDKLIKHFEILIKNILDEKLVQALFFRELKWNIKNDKEFLDEIYLVKKNIGVNNMRSSFKDEDTKMNESMNLNVDDIEKFFYMNPEYRQLSYSKYFENLKLDNVKEIYSDLNQNDFSNNLIKFLKEKFNSIEVSEFIDKFYYDSKTFESYLDIFKSFSCNKLFNLSLIILNTIFNKYLIHFFGKVNYIKFQNNNSNSNELPHSDLIKIFKENLSEDTNVKIFDLDNWTSMYEKDNNDKNNGLNLYNSISKYFRDIYKTWFNIIKNCIITIINYNKFMFNIFEQSNDLDNDFELLRNNIKETNNLNELKTKFVNFIENQKKYVNENLKNLKSQYIKKWFLKKDLTLLNYNQNICYSDIHLIYDFFTSRYTDPLFKFKQNDNETINKIFNNIKNTEYYKKNSFKENFNEYDDFKKFEIIMQFLNISNRNTSDEHIKPIYKDLSNIFNEYFTKYKFTIFNIFCTKSDSNNLNFKSYVELFKNLISSDSNLFKELKSILTYYNQIQHLKKIFLSENFQDICIFNNNNVINDKNLALNDFATFKNKCEKIINNIIEVINQINALNIEDLSKNIQYTENDILKIKDEILSLKNYDELKFNNFKKLCSNFIDSLSKEKSKLIDAVCKRYSKLYYRDRIVERNVSNKSCSLNKLIMKTLNKYIYYLFFSKYSYNNCVKKAYTTYALYTFDIENKSSDTKYTWTFKPNLEDKLIDTNISSYLIFNNIPYLTQEYFFQTMYRCMKNSEKNFMVNTPSLAIPRRDILIELFVNSIQSLLNKIKTFDNDENMINLKNAIIKKWKSEINLINDPIMKDFIKNINDEESFFDLCEKIKGVGLIDKNYSGKNWKEMFLDLDTQKKRAKFIYTHFIGLIEILKEFLNQSDEYKQSPMYDQNLFTKLNNFLESDIFNKTTHQLKQLYEKSNVDDLSNNLITDYGISLDKNDSFWEFVPSDMYDYTQNLVGGKIQPDLLSILFNTIKDPENKYKWNTDKVKEYVINDGRYEESFGYVVAKHPYDRYLINFCKMLSLFDSPYKLVTAFKHTLENNELCNSQCLPNQEMFVINNSFASDFISFKKYIDDYFNFNDLNINKNDLIKQFDNIVDQTAQQNLYNVLSAKDDLQYTSYYQILNNSFYHQDLIQNIVNIICYNDEDWIKMLQEMIDVSKIDDTNYDSD